MTAETLTVGLAGFSMEIPSDGVPLPRGEISKTNHSKFWQKHEVIELIKIVRNEKAVYDPQHRNHSSKQHMNRFWRATDIKLRKYPGACLQKWALLRNQFRKEQSKVEKTKIVSHWKFYELMKFLDPYLRRSTFSTEQIFDEDVRNALNELEGVTRTKLKKSVPNISPRDSINEPEEDMADDMSYREEILESTYDSSSEAWVNDDNEFYETEYITENIEEDNPTGAEDSTNEIVGHIETVECTKSPEKSPHLEEKSSEETSNHTLVEEIHAHVSKPSTSELCKCKTDPDAMFLLSLLPDIQSLSKRDKGQFKLTIQKFLQDILYSNDN